MRIDIWSDVVCPWCYLGHRRFVAAAEQLGLDDAEVHWRAFQLDPDAPSGARPLAPVIDAKYGPGAFEVMAERLGGLGHEVGIDFRFDRARRVNTGDAHRLLAWAAERDHGQELLERLFAAYFTEGVDLSSHPALAAQAAAVGLPADEAAAVLDSKQYATAVLEDQAAGRAAGVTGVPSFVVDGNFLIPGAQDVDRLVALLGRIRERSRIT
jgi:predicted DsbA family dithiol-disulfide isomerase